VLAFFSFPGLPLLGLDDVEHAQRFLQLACCLAVTGGSGLGNLCLQLAAAARHASALNGFLISAQPVQLVTYAFQRVASAIAQRLHLLLGAGDRTFQLAQIALVQQREGLAQPAGFAAEALERNGAALIAVHQILKRQLLLKILLLNLLALPRSEEHTSELQSREKLVCRLPLEKKNDC